MKQYPIDLITHTIPMHKKFKNLDSMFSRTIFKKGKVLYEKIVIEWLEAANDDLLVIQDILEIWVFCHMENLHLRMQKNFTNLL